jgi:hypothetical protein
VRAATTNLIESSDGSKAHGPSTFDLRPLQATESTGITAAIGTAPSAASRHVIALATLRVWREVRCRSAVLMQLRDELGWCEDWQIVSEAAEEVLVAGDEVCPPADREREQVVVVGIG